MSDFQYKVSVVIPVYNCAEHLERCAKSLTKQTIRKSQLEVIFVNDGSKDGSGEMVSLRRTLQGERRRILGEEYGHQACKGQIHNVP